jgi:drug/metabolite transporter (DMT)-like permease
MGNPWPAIVAGLILICIGIVFARWEIKAFRLSRQEIPEGHPDRDYAFRRFRRRMQVAVMILAVGVLIPLGDFLFEQKIREQKVSPLWFAIYWLGVLLLAAWIGIMGLADFLMMRIRTGRSLRELEAQREEINNAIQEFRERKTSRRYENN